MNNHKWSHYLTLFKEEFIYIFFKDPRRGMLIFLACTIYLLLFGTLYQQGVINHIPTAILDQDQTATSRQLIEDINDSQKFDVRYNALNQEDLQHFMDTHHDWVAFHIPPHFSKDVALSRSSNVLMMIDGSNLVMTSVSSIGGLEIVKYFSDEQAVRLLERYGAQTPSQAQLKITPVDINYRLIGNQTLSYLIFFALGLALAAFQQGVLLTAAAAYINEGQPLLYFEKTLNPIGRVFVKMLPYWLLSMLGFSLMIFVANDFMAIPIGATNLWPLYGLMGAFSFALIGLSTIITAFIRSEITFTRVSVCYTVPAFILSGFTWPLAGMTPFTRFLAYLSPLTYVANSFRNYYLNGYDSHIEINTFILLMIGILSLSIGIYFQHKRLQKYFQ